MRYKEQSAAARRARRRAYQAKDNERRTLVGARLPRETAERVKDAARAERVSVYRWVSDAIDRALHC